MDQHYHISLEDLLVKYLLLEASPEERRTVDQWLAADPANQQHFDQLRLIWEKSLDLPGIKETEGEEERSWQTLKEKMCQPGQPGQTSQTSRPTPIRRLRWTVVATAAAAALLAFLWWRPASTAWQTTASNEHIRIDTLADGSIVTLNKHSILIAKERTVNLQGEAFFQIAPDKDRPFHVQTNGITITVLGTSFNVRTKNNKTAITVETGLIEVHNRQSHIRVTAGEAITLGENDSTIKTQPAGNTLYKYYQPRVFVCRDTPLGDLIDALNQAYGDSITIENPAIRQLPITTTFRDEPLNQVLDVIQKTLGITIKNSNSRYILK